MTQPIPAGSPPQPYRRRRSKTPQFVALAILLACALAALFNFALDSAQRRAARRLPNPVPATADALAAAKTNYETKCASCHGTNGDGKGEKAANLWTAPTDFRNAGAMSRHTDGDLYWVTTKGNWPMPSFKSKLSDLERWQLIDYIRTFARANGAPTAP